MKELAFAIVFLTLFFTSVASDLSAIRAPQATATSLVAMQ